MQESMMRNFLERGARSAASAVLLAALGLGSGGCSSADDSPEDAVAQQSAALANCSNETRDDIADIGIEAQCAHSGYSAVSGTDYDHPGCPNQYVRATALTAVRPCLDECSGPTALSRRVRPVRPPT